MGRRREYAHSFVEAARLLGFDKLLPLYTVDVRDPRGRRVRCKRDVWLNKIVATRPEFGGLVAEVSAAVRQPAFINKSREAGRLCYYSAAPPEWTEPWLRVIVTEAEGWLISAHPKDKEAPKETRIWTTP